MCRQSHRPRGDAVVRFQSKEGARNAVEDLHCTLCFGTGSYVVDTDELS